MNYLDATDLIRLNAEIEHNLTLDGDLLPLPGKDPLLLLANRHQDGYVFYYRRQVPLALREQIDALGPQRAFEDDAAVQAILAGYSPCMRLVEGVGGYFSAAPIPDEFSGVILEGDTYQIEVDGQAVSRAWTCAAWAAGVMQAGRVAFYSYLADNEASAALARSLGVVEYATWVAYLRCRSPQMSRTRVASGGITANEEQRMGKSDWRTANGAE